MKSFLLLLGFMQSLYAGPGTKLFKKPELENPETASKSFFKISNFPPKLLSTVNAHHSSPPPQKQKYQKPFILYSTLVSHFWSKDHLIQLRLAVDPTTESKILDLDGESTKYIKTGPNSYLGKIFSRIGKLKNLRSLEIIFSTADHCEEPTSFIPTNDDGEVDEGIKKSIGNWASSLKKLHLEKLSLSTGMNQDGEVLANYDMGLFIEVFLKKLFSGHICSLKELFLYPIDPSFIKYIFHKTPELQKIEGAPLFANLSFPARLNGRASVMKLDYELKDPFRPKAPLKVLSFQQSLPSLLRPEFLKVLQDILNHPNIKKSLKELCIHCPPNQKIDELNPEDFVLKITQIVKKFYQCVDNKEAKLFLLGIPGNKLNVLKKDYPNLRLDYRILSPIEEKILNDCETAHRLLKNS